MGRSKTPANVLCLGMSYACVNQQLKKEGVSWHHIIHKEPSVNQTVELVRRNVLTEMDGRDLARCISMENSLNTKAYTVSQESGAEYAENHLNGNFNRRTFFKEIRRKWGTKIRFRQIILDYFWIPQGTWVMNHWARSFFLTILPGFVEEGLLEFETNQSRKNNPGNVGVGVVYLPFCFHCVKMIVSCLRNLSKYYTISFVYTWELDEHALWAGTSKICGKTMQEWLGKQLNQEDIYCTFTHRDVKECIEDAHVTKEDVVDVLRRIEDFGDVRMIRLKPLLKHDPDRRKPRSCRLQVPEKKMGVDIGGFVGLKDPGEVKRGYYELESEESSVTESSDQVSDVSEDDQELVAKSSGQAKKAQKKSVPLALVSSSDEEKSANDGKKKRRKRKKPVSPAEEDKPKKFTILNLCPEIHPTEPDFCNAEMDDGSSSTSSSALATDECHGFDLLLAAAEMIQESQQSQDPVSERSSGGVAASESVIQQVSMSRVDEERKQKLLEEICVGQLPEESRESMGALVQYVEVRDKEGPISDERIVLKNKEGQFVAGAPSPEVHQAQNIQVAVSSGGTTSASTSAVTREEQPAHNDKVADSSGGTTSASTSVISRKEHEAQNDKVAVSSGSTTSASTSVVRRKEQPAHNDTVTDSSVGTTSASTAAISRNEELTQNYKEPVSSGGTTSATTSVISRNLEQAQTTGSSTPVVSKRRLGLKPPKKRKVRQNSQEREIDVFTQCSNRERRLNTEHSTGNPFDQQIPQEQGSLGSPDFQLPPENPYLSAPYNTQTLPSNVRLEVSRGDLILRNGRMLLEQSFPVENTPYCYVNASLADEVFVGSGTASVRSHVAPETTIAELTRFLVEKVNPMQWLMRLCIQSRPYGTRHNIPHQVFISYGPDHATLVHFINSDNRDYGEISVGLQLGPHGSILSPFDTAMMQLSPYRSVPTEVQLVTRGMMWQHIGTSYEYLQLQLPVQPVGVW